MVGASKTVEPFEILSWDTNFWGCRIARIPGALHSRAALKDSLIAARAANVSCVYYLIDSSDELAARALAATALNMVDLRLTLSGPALGDGLDDGTIRPAAPADIEHLRGIAASSHSDTRFYFDGNFPRAKCDELYATWIENSVVGSLADVVLVSDSESGVTGYITAKLGAEGACEIGLLAVAQEVRGRGQGSALLRAAQRWASSRGCSTVRVVTQGRNLNAQRLYLRHGFLPVSLQVWYHAWLDS